jgi:DNA-directed RNA polymerase
VKLVVGDKKEVWKDKAKDAVTANFVHSVDATHLQFVELVCADEGIDLAVVHDCFGCLAPRARRLKEIIPEQYIHLHKHHNLLAGVWSSARRILPQRVKLPPPPEIGDLEIEQVIKSFHAWK